MEDSEEGWCQCRFGEVEQKSAMRTREKRLPGKWVKRHVGRKLSILEHGETVGSYQGVTEDQAEEVSRTKS